MGKNKLLNLFTAILILFFLFSCDTGSSSSSNEQSNIQFSDDGYVYYNFPCTDENIFLYNLMNEVYFWKDEMITSKRLDEYESNYELLDDLKVDRDPWSFIVTIDEYNAAYVDGANEMWGFYSGFNADNELRLREVYIGSPFYEAGLRRGDRILSIDGYDPYTMYLDDRQGFFDLFRQNSAQFNVELSNGGTVNRTIYKTETEITSVYEETLWTLDDQTSVGYFAYTSFNNLDEEEIGDLFQYFYDAQIDELIIDLRDNSGGHLYMVSLIASYIIGAQQNGNLMYSMEYNTLYNQWNRYQNYESLDVSLDLERVVFLTTHSSASASEILIAALSPYIETVVIGETTSGKPMGMNSFGSPDNLGGNYIYFPICFSLYNSEGFGEYFDGLSVDSAHQEKWRYNYGDREDPMIADALNYLNSGDFLPSDMDAGMRSVYNPAVCAAVDQSFPLKVIKGAIGHD